MGVSPRECVVFEDTGEAIRTAKAAGFTVAGVTDKNKSDNKEILETADFVIDDFERVYMDLKAEVSLI